MTVSVIIKSYIHVQNNYTRTETLLAISCYYFFGAFDQKLKHYQEAHNKGVYALNHIRQ